MDIFAEHKGCFICDERIVGNSENIVSAITSCTNTHLIDKLRNLLGKDYVVIVNQDDRVCENCSSLFDKIDELEYDLEHSYKILKDLLTNKYAILLNESGDNNEAGQIKEKHNEKTTLKINSNIPDSSKQVKTFEELKQRGNNGRMNSAYFCSVCNEKIADKNCLNRHIVQKHIVINESNIFDRYTCNVCLQRFSCEELCEKHVDITHINHLIVCNESSSETLNRSIDPTSNEVNQENFNCVRSYSEDFQNSNTFKETTEVIIDSYKKITSIEVTVVDGSNVDSSVGKSVGDNYENKPMIQDQKRCLDCILIHKTLNNVDTSLGNEKNNFFQCGKCCKQQNNNNFNTKKKLNKLLPDLVKPNEAICEPHIEKHVNLPCSKMLMPKSFQSKDEIIGAVENMSSSVITTSTSNNIKYCVNLLNNKVADRQLNKEKYGINEDLKNKNSENFSNSTEICNLEQYMCKSCNSIFDTELSLIYHLKDSHGNKFFFCELCNQVFNDRNLLSSHVISDHPDRDSSNYCQVCNKNYNKKFDLIDHIIYAHLKDKLCTICKKRFKNKAMFLKHVEFAHRDNLLCRNCEMELEDLDKLIAHERCHKKEFVCEICCKVLKTQSSLKAHKILLHTGEYPYICEICGKGFISTHTLNEHKGKHSKESRYICDICGKGYRLYDTYHKHRNHHDNPYPKQCNICHQYFRSSSRLAEHRRRKHTLERPYKCPHCSLSFHISSLLKHHLFKHTRQYPYTCVTCDKGFPSRIKYASHMSKKHKDDSLIKNRFPNNKERREEWLKCSRKVL